LIIRTGPGGVSLLLVVAMVVAAGVGVHGARRAAMVGAGLAAVVATTAESDMSSPRTAPASDAVAFHERCNSGTIRAGSWSLPARLLAVQGLIGLPPPVC
jgi:hypothetical protein